MFVPESINHDSFQCNNQWSIHGLGFTMKLAHTTKTTKLAIIIWSLLFVCQRARKQKSVQWVTEWLIAAHIFSRVWPINLHSMHVYCLKTTNVNFMIHKTRKINKKGHFNTSAFDSRHVGKKKKNASSEMCNQLKSFSAFRKKWNDSIIHQKYRLNKCSFRLSSESHK